MAANGTVYTPPSPAEMHPGQVYSDGPIYRDSDMSELSTPEPVVEDPRVAEAISEIHKRAADVMPSNAAIELALQHFEQNYMDERTHAQRWEGQERWLGKENEAARMVNIMHPYEFIRRLRRAGVAARIDEDRHARLWLNEGIALMTLKRSDGTTRKVSSGRIGITAWLPDERAGRMVAQTVTTLQYPYGPEYSIMRFNEYDVPQDEKYRGWRTALLVLVISGVLSEAEAERAFGPAYGPAAAFYQEQLYKHRASKLGIVSQEKTA